MSDTPFNLNDDQSIPPKPNIPMDNDEDAFENHRYENIGGINAPLVIFYGPREVGKTVTLLRFSEYVSRVQAARFTPVPSFISHPAYQKTQQLWRKAEMDMLNNGAPPATSNIRFICFDLTINGSHFCQFLEAPGEHFFQAGQTVADYPVYLNQIFGGNYRKIYYFFFSPNMLATPQNRTSYAMQVTDFLTRGVVPGRDSVAILYSQVDTTNYFNHGRINHAQVEQSFYGNPDFAPLINYLTGRNPHGGRIPFITFSSGRFVDRPDGGKGWTISNDEYPEGLWRSLGDFINGGGIRLPRWMRRG